MMAKENAHSSHGSLVALIAWLSTCLLAGGLGTMIDPSTHVLWLRAGCFGLVAAVGLDAAARMRARRQRVKHFRALQRRCDRSLEMITTERDIVDSLRTAIAHLLTVRPQTAREGLTGFEEQRWTCNLPVEVFAVRREHSVECSEDEAVGVIGRLDNLSNSGFGLILAEKLSARLVIITLLPHEDQEFDLLAEILWCDPCPDGRMRVGGRLLRVLPPGTHTSVDSPATENEELAAEAAC
jgi:hypothetical protein